MKNFILLLIFSFRTNFCLEAQEPCKREYLINDSVKLKLMMEYRSRDDVKTAFVNGKGVYKLIRFKDKNGNANWRLSVLIEDSFKNNLPSTYAYYGHDIILIYEGDLQMNAIKNPFDIQKLECLEAVIKDRLYIRPPFQNKSMVYDGIEGRPFGKDSGGNFITRPVNAYQTTGGGSEVLVIFNKDMSAYKINQAY